MLRRAHQQDQKQPAKSPHLATSAYGKYALNVGFNLKNKQIFNIFPFPWTVSAIHVVVGLVYCTVAYLVGAKKASFQRVSNLDRHFAL